MLDRSKGSQIAIAEHFGAVFDRGCRHSTTAVAKGKALLGDLANLFKIAECVEQIQQARIGRAKAAFEGIGRCFQKLGDLFRVLKLPGSEHDKPDIIASATSRPSGHLLQFAGRQCTPAVDCRVYRHS